MEALIGFLSGVGVALVGSLVALWLQRAKEQKDRIDKAEFRIYMHLLDISNHYFFIASAEIDPENRKIDQATKIRIQEKAWTLLDEIREEDRVESLEEMCRVIMSEDFESASQRHDAMNALIRELGKRVSPKFSKVAERLSRENLMKLGQPYVPGNQVKRTAPAGLWP